MLALTLFEPRPWPGLQQLPHCPGYSQLPPANKKITLEDCLNSESQCFTCTMLRLTAFQGGSSFRFVLFSWNNGLMIDRNKTGFGLDKGHCSWQLIQARLCSNPLPQQASQSPAAKVTAEQVERCCKLLPTVANCKSRPPQ